MDIDEFSQAGGASDDEGEVLEQSSNKFSDFIGRMDNIQDGQDMEDDIDIDELMSRAAGKRHAPTEEQEILNIDSKKQRIAEIYKQDVSNLLNFLRANKTQIFAQDGPNGLQKYSPKFLRMIQNITNPDHIGLNLIYSQFRTLEGIGIFSIALEANGFAQFKIKRSALTWEIDMSEDDWAKPHYALYTGTEDAEEKEIIRKIYNGDWDKIPDTISSKLLERNHNNNVGEIIKVLMITASGSEGINLRNTRYVHIMEPYWNPVRAEQVIGRARRICSHQGLPKELQTVEVFLYLMIFSQAQIDRASIELKLDDVSKIVTPTSAKLDKNIVFTSEQTLHEISYIKKTFSDQIMTAIKEASIDCATHVKGNTKEGLQCLNFGNPDVDERSFTPNIIDDEKGNVAIAKEAFTKTKILWQPQDITIKGVLYVQRVGTDQIYDYESFKRTKENQQSENPIPGIEPILKGHITKKDGVTKFIRVV